MATPFEEMSSGGLGGLRRGVDLSSLSDAELSDLGNSLKSGSGGLRRGVDLSSLSDAELSDLGNSLKSGSGGLAPSAPVDYTDYSAGSAPTRGLSRGWNIAGMGYGSALEGIGKKLGLEGVEEYGGEVVAKQKEEYAKKAPYATRLKDVREAEGVLDTAGELASFTGSALGESLPQMGTTIGGSLAGAAAGARAGLVAGLPGAVVGGIAGGLLANIPFFYGTNREAQKEAVADGTKIEVDEGAAFLGSLAQAPMDLIADRVTFGLSKLGGVNIEKIIRQGGLFTRGVKGAVAGATIEVPTEVGQQVIERFQAGRPIDSPEAMEEYLEVAAAAGLVGGSIRGATNIVGGDPEARAEKLETERLERLETERLEAIEAAKVAETERLAAIEAAETERLAAIRKRGGEGEQLDLAEPGVPVGPAAQPFAEADADAAPAPAPVPAGPTVSFNKGKVYTTDGQPFARKEDIPVDGTTKVTTVYSKSTYTGAYDAEGNLNGEVVIRHTAGEKKGKIERAFFTGGKRDKEAERKAAQQPETRSEELARHERILEQRDVEPLGLGGGTETTEPRREYVDPTAGLAPELTAEKERLLDEIYDLEVNIPNTVDEAVLAPIREAIQVRDDAVRAVNRQITDFAGNPKNKQKINAARAASTARITELSVPLAEPRVVDPRQGDLFSLPPVAAGTAGTAGATAVSVAAPPMFQQGKAKTLGDELGKLPEYQDEAGNSLFENDRFRITTGEGGLDLAQVKQVRKNIDFGKQGFSYNNSKVQKIKSDSKLTDKDIRDKKLHVNLRGRVKIDLRDLKAIDIHVIKNAKRRAEAKEAARPKGTLSLPARDVDAEAAAAAEAERIEAERLAAVDAEAAEAAVDAEDRGAVDVAEAVDADNDNITDPTERNKGISRDGDDTPLEATAPAFRQAEADANAERLRVEVEEQENRPPVVREADKLRKLITQAQIKLTETETSLSALAQLEADFNVEVKRTGLVATRQVAKTRLLNAVKNYTEYTSDNMEALRGFDMHAIYSLDSDGVKAFNEGKIRDLLGTAATPSDARPGQVSYQLGRYSIPFDVPTRLSTTVAKTEAIILERLGKAGVERISVTTTPEAAGLTDIESTASGVVIDGKPYLFTDNITEGDELGILLHELGVHIGMPALVGSGNYKFLINRIKQFAELNDDSREAQLAKRALERVKAAENVVPTNTDDELIAYFVEEAINRGINPTSEIIKSTKIGIWFRRFIAGVKNILNKIPGIKFKGDFNVQEIVDIAYGGANLAVRSPYIKHTNAERNVQYSLAIPPGTVGNALNSTFNAIQKASPEWSQGVIDSIITGLYNIPEYLKYIWYNLLSLRQMADTVDRLGPAFKDVANSIRKLNALVNKRRHAIDESRLEWQNDLIAARSHAEGYSKADVAEFFDIVHDSTIDEIDLRSTDPVVTNTPLAKRFAALVAKSTDIGKYDLRISYKIMADRYQKAGDALLAFYEKTMDEPLSIAEKTRLGFAKGRITPYFPLMRDGAWWVDHKDTEDGELQTFTSSFDSKLKAQNAVEKLKAQGLSIEKRRGSEVYMRTRNDELADSGGGLAFMGKMQTALEVAIPEGEGKKEAIARLKELILNAYPTNSLKQQFKKRRNVRGFRDDVFQNFGSMGLKLSSELALLDNMKDINDTISAIEAQSDEGKVHPILAPIIRSIQKRAAFIRSPTPNRLASRLSFGGYAWFILGNISSSIVNLTQLPLVTYGLLAGEFGHAKAAGAIASGFKAYLKFHKDANTEVSMFGIPLADRTAFGGKFIDPNTADGREMQRLFDQALANGIIRRTTSQELQEASLSRDAMTSNFVKAELALGYVFQNSERANREISLLAAYSLAKERYKNSKLSREENEDIAMERAFELVEQANGPALAEAGPQFFQDSWGKVIGTFKRFALSQLYLQYKLIRDINPLVAGLESDPKLPAGAPTARTLAARQLGSILIPAWMFAGVKGLPFYGTAEIIDTLISSALGDEDDLDQDFNMKMRALAGDLGYRGPLSHFTNLDFASRTGFYGLAYRDDPYRRSQVGAFTYALESTAGPAYAAFIRNPDKALEKFNDGDLYGAIQTATPSFIRNIMKAGKLATEGAVTNKGLPIVENINTYNTVMQVLGFSPNNLTEAYQRNEFLSRQSRKITDRRSRLLLLLNMARHAGDSDGMAEIMDKINKFNAQSLIINARQQIESDTISRSRKSWDRSAAETLQGLRLQTNIRPAVEADLKLEAAADM